MKIFAEKVNVHFIELLIIKFQRIYFWAAWKFSLKSRVPEVSCLLQCFLFKMASSCKKYSNFNKGTQQKIRLSPSLKIAKFSSEYLENCEKYKN